VRRALKAIWKAIFKYFTIAVFIGQQSWHGFCAVILVYSFVVKGTGRGVLVCGKDNIWAAAHIVSSFFSPKYVIFICSM